MIENHEAKNKGLLKVTSLTIDKFWEQFKICYIVKTSIHVLVECCFLSLSIMLIIRYIKVETCENETIKIIAGIIIMCLIHAFNSVRLIYKAILKIKGSI